MERSVEKTVENAAEKTADKTVEKTAAAEKKFEIQYNQRLFIQGCILTLLGVTGPFLIPARFPRIYDSLYLAMKTESGGPLILAAMKLVFMNVARMIPHYLGVFLLDDSIHVYIRGKRHFEFNVAATFGLIILVYEAIYYIHGMRYDFGFPAILTILLVLLLSYLDLFSVSILNKIVLVGSLLLSIQWLDVIPALTSHGFGRGEISVDVKMIANFMGERMLLTEFAIVMCIVFSFASVTQIQLLYKEHKLRISNEKTRQVEKELYHMQLETLKVRNFSEVQSLVHDLKSPLTTAQGLISLVEMMEQGTMVQEYFQKISSSLAIMGTMISEILYENARSRLETAELMRMVLAQVSVVIPSGVMDYTNHCPEAVIKGNRIRLSRAVINLLSNAYQAVDKENGKIIMTVEKEGGWISITVQDNGTGMEPEQMEHIWDIGYSKWNSMGGGLPFVRQVVENHEGTVEITSKSGEYTRAVIRLREEDEADGKYEDNSGYR